MFALGRISRHGQWTLCRSAAIGRGHSRSESMPHPQFISNQSVVPVNAQDPIRAADGSAPRGDLLAKVQPAVQAMRTNPELEWTVESLAEVSKMSRSVFAEQFHLAMGVPPGKFLLDCRMQRASELLRNRSLGIKEIAAKVGYGSESSFGNAFKRWAGRPPGAFRGAELAGAAPPPPTVL